jgi:hypothetical protein
MRVMIGYACYLWMTAITVSMPHPIICTAGKESWIKLGKLIVETFMQRAMKFLVVFATGVTSGVCVGGGGGDGVSYMYVHVVIVTS